MIKTTKIKYRRLMNELEYLHEERELLEDIISSAAGDFEVYYKGFCARHNVDLNKLNDDNKERISDLYGVEPEEVRETPISEYTGSAAMVKVDTIEDEPLFEETEEELGRFKKLHEYFNKLFKKIAMQLHPDKIENYTANDEYKRKMAWDFSEAKSALDKKSYFKLIQIAKKHNIHVTEHFTLQLKWFKKERDTLMKTISKAKTTYNYKFAECETDEEKDEIIEQFMWHLFRFRLDS
tara:strand:+ start:321 stop:1031 length:711 start_codon:yes stop_codon:yes gene_type:complete